MEKENCSKIFIIICFLFLVFCPSIGFTQEEDDGFMISNIDDATFGRMQRGGSYPKECTVKRNDLRYLKVLYVDFNGKTEVGEIVCNKAIAQDLIDIFRELYKQKYPICHIALIDEYGADDETSMRANNTSCFCYRTIKGSSKLSKHSLGMAIDINPLQNPCVRYTKNGKLRRIEPDTEEARKYIKRATMKAHVITSEDLCYKLFLQHGFRWGGAWRTVKDYQHFEK